MQVLEYHSAIKISHNIRLKFGRNGFPAVTTSLRKHASRKGSPSSLSRGGKEETQKKRLVQSPNSYFMDVKCPGCYKIITLSDENDLTALIPFDGRLSQVSPTLVRH
ncbi:hypothetical protein U0070_003334 [Myodes glareolus]|uniref:Uncharacterized protein n=1 Tax=Myodes glareolus TaxID=447135 RepID=A0AAW0JA18_MYOGA